MCFSDMDSDGINELIVASEDCCIRVFKNENIHFEVTEAANCVCLARMNKNRFAFGLSNGMVCVYHKKTRKWRAKNQVLPVAIVQGNFEKDEGKFAYSSAAPTRLPLR